MRLLRARAAIEDLMYSYCAAIDRLDVERLRSVFADDARIDKGSTSLGREEFVQGVLRRHADIAQCSHAVGNIEVSLLSRKLAMVEAYGLEVERHEDEAGGYDLLYRVRYSDVVVRTGGRWVIRDKAIVLDHVMRADVVASARELEAGRTLGRRDETDPARVRALQWGAHGAEAPPRHGFGRGAGTPR